MKPQDKPHDNLSVVKAEFDKFLQEMQSGLQIDKHSLDVDSMRHADLFYRVSNRLELEISRRDEIKQQLSEEKAEVDAKVRKDAAIAGERITEKEVESIVVLDKRVRILQINLHHANLMVGQLKALKESYEQRSYMISHLSTLFTAGYWSNDPGSTPRIIDKNKTDAANHTKTVLRQVRTVRVPRD